MPLRNIPTIKISVIESGSLELTKRPAKFHVGDEGQLFCSDIDSISYDCEIRGSLWIAPSLEQWADKQNGYWEWENAETIVFVPDSDKVRFRAPE